MDALDRIERAYGCMQEYTRQMEEREEPDPYELLFVEPEFDEEEWAALEHFYKNDPKPPSFDL